MTSRLRALGAPCGLIILSLTLLMTLNLSVSLACPGCQNPTLPVIPSGGVYLDQRELQWGALLSLAPMWVEHEAGCADLNSCDEPVKQPRHFHDQQITPVELRLSADWGLSERLGLSAQLPLRLIYTTVQYKLPNGASYEPLDAGIHHRDETLIGLGDAILALRWGESSSRGWWLVGQLGVTLPLGRTEKNPFLAGDQGEEHQHVQMGSGTFDPFTSIAVARSLGRLQVSGYVQLSGALYENPHGLRVGLTSLMSARVAYRVQQRALLQGGLAWFRQGPERWDGQVQQDGVIGRQELLLSLGGLMSFSGPQHLIQVQIPIWRELYQGLKTEVGSLWSPVALTLGVQGRL